MATATAIRSTRSMLEDEAKLAELYSDFGARLYSSSRPPFSMQAFSLKTFPDKQCSGPVGNGGLYTRRAFKNLKSPNAWKVAAALVKRAIRLKPSSWGDHFLLGKCVWKLYGISVDFGVCCKPTPLHLMVGALDAFVRAVETTPERKDTTRQDPILEPIYKVVSVVHKLVDREELEAESGASVIESVLIKQRQFEIQNFPLLADFDSWQSYVLDVLRVLRAADKSRWHHRLVFRAARILYDKHHDGTAGARLAKDYLIEQHLYSTKTLALTVWKPDHERPGRHWIYMTQYARFIILLLEETDDLEAMQILARRVRRKVNEFFEHEALWDELCTAHLRLHRRHGNILEHFDDVVFKNVTQEELEPRAALIDQWTASSKTSHPLSQVLHETVELKKLNAGLMKGSAFDEVIIDTYAHIYDTIVPTLEIAKRASHTASAPAPLSAPTSPSTDDRRNVMSLTNLMNLDGAIDMRLAAFNPNSIPPTPLMPATQPEPTKPRSRPVLRRDIIKRATDAVSAKPAPQPAARAHTPPRRQPTDSGVRVVVGAPIDVISPRSERAEGLNVSVNEGAVLSAPGSVHDDADDESELSEIEAEEEAVVKQPMFPNLKPREVSIQGAAGVDGEVVAEEEAQGGGDGDVEMGEL